MLNTAIVETAADVTRPGTPETAVATGRFFSAPAVSIRTSLRWRRMLADQMHAFQLTLSDGANSTNIPTPCP